MDITKAQLKTLAGHKGQFDKDSGKVFVTFVGVYDVKAKVFRGEPTLSELVTDDTAGSFSLSSVLAPKKPKQKSTTKETDDIQ